MKEKITERILKEVQIPDLLDVLSKKLNQPDLQSLLLEVFRKRTKSLTPAYLLQQYEQSRFVQPAAVSSKQIVEFDRLAFSVLPASFEILELSPVCPLGTNSIVAPVDQDNAVSTIRNTEVCSDSTNVMALECARRRKTLINNPAENKEVKLCASHRLLRPHLTNDPASFPHFRIFSMCTAGRDKGNYEFEIASLIEHIGFFIQLFLNAMRDGYKLQTVRISFIVYDEAGLEIIKTKVIDKLQHYYSEVEYSISKEQRIGNGYYSGVRYQIFIADYSEVKYFIVDGGFTDWTQKLLSNKKERLLISGMGSERFIFCFGTDISVYKEKEVNIYFK
jgi:hypothetical protein